MLNPFELKEADIKPRINDISLKLLSEYYEMFLYPFIYHYYVKSAEKEKEIELHFDIENFCHLLGIESTVKYSVPMRELHNYRGKNGWNNIANLSIDIPHLKNINAKKFKSMKAKYVYFYLLPKLVENPMAVRYDIHKVNTATNIACEILFFSKVENDNAIIHLGIEKATAGYYVPRTFFIEKVSQKEKDIYIANQEEIHVEVKHRVILQGVSKHEM